MAAVRERQDAIHTQGSISMGFSEPFLSLIAATVAGIICRLAVFITVKSIILWEAFSGAVLRSSFSISFIAAIPKGVEAFPRPRRFAVRLRAINLRAFPFLLSPLNSRESMGETASPAFR